MEKPLRITGSLKSVETAKQLVTEVLANINDRNSFGGRGRGVDASKKDGGNVLLMWIPRNRKGQLIGKGGEQIRQLQEQSGAKIVIEVRVLPENTGFL